MSETCKYCDRIFEYDRSKGHRHNVCGNCRVNARRTRIKTKAVEYLGGKCIKCGYCKCINALDFHHIDETTKAFTLSDRYSYSWAVWVKELDKCELLCANCHREHHSSS